MKNNYFYKKPLSNIYKKPNVISEVTSQILYGEKFKIIAKNKKWINCENEIQSIDSFIFENWLERLYFERLEQKSSIIQEILATNNNNWEATLFIVLAKSFGLKVNGEAFLNFVKQ